MHKFAGWDAMHLRSGDQCISAAVREALMYAVLAAEHILGLQDCIYGMRRCLSGACMPFQPCLATITVSCFHTQHGFMTCAVSLRGRLHDLQIRMADRIDGLNIDEHGRTMKGTE